MSRRYPGGVVSATAPTVTAAGASGLYGLTEQTQYQGGNNWPPFKIGNSLRFRSAASAYLSKTPSVAGNRKTWTYSTWIKRGTLGTRQAIFGLDIGSDTTTFFIEFESGDVLSLDGHSLLWRKTTQVFRDPSAWYHLVVAVDTTQATADNRIKIYVNGSQITSFSTTNNPSQNADMGVNATNAHYISRTTTGLYSDNYQAEINFVDGQALTPSSFGGTDKNGIWSPIAYTGSYGTNGFYLPFNETTSATTLGYDKSGNGNNWTLNNFNVSTSNATYDIVSDAPVDQQTGDASRSVGNYCTWNPLDKTMERDTAGLLTWSNANLYASTPQGVDGTRGTIWLTPSQGGKFYFEVTRETASNEVSCGIASEADKKDTGAGGQLAKGGAGLAPAIRSNGDLLYNNVLTSGWAPSYTAGDIIGIAVNCDTGAVYFSKNGAWINGSGGTTTFASAANASTSGLATIVTPFGSMGDNDGLTLNCGQRPFAYTPPSGYKTICTTNLLDPTIKQGNLHFDSVLRSGFGTSGGSITTNFKPDLVSERMRNGTSYHTLWDSNRGLPNSLYTNTAAGDTSSTWLSSFNSNGVTFATNDYGSSYTFVEWMWKAGEGTNTTNTSGSVTSSVSVNATAGFSIVTYTGPGSGGGTVGHGLGVAPKMIIAKNRSATENWRVYHTSLGATNYMDLNGTGASTSSSSVWNNTAPTSSVFSIANDSAVSGSGNGIVAYCFAEIDGYSKIGSYVGNGSTDGPFVYCGFKPKFVLLRSTSNLREWFIVDTSRSTYNLVNTYLRVNTNSAEGTDTMNDLVSNGFKMRSSDTAFNGSGETYIFMAFAENPFKYARAR